MKYLALNWVKATIIFNLKQTRQTLEQFVEEPNNDTAFLQPCVMWLHETQLVLNVLQLQTVAILVQNIELTIQSWLENQIEGTQNKELTYEALMRALIQLPNYLEYLAIVQHEKPFVLLPLINDLRACRSQPALAPNSFFAFFMSDSPTQILCPRHSNPNQKPVNLSDDKQIEYMQKMRTAYQQGLATIVKEPKQPEAGLKIIFTVLQRLQQVTGTAPISKIWWISEAVVEALLQNCVRDTGLKLNKSIFNLLKQLDPLIKQIIQHGNAALGAAPPKNLLSNLLYLVAHVRSDGKQISTIKELFKLNGVVDTKKSILAGPDIELIKIVVCLIKEEFARIKETLEIFYNNQTENLVSATPSVAELKPLVTTLRQMANTLILLGLTAQAQTLLTVAGLIFEISEGNKPPNLPNLLGIAHALLRTDMAMDILAEQGIHARQNLDERLNQVLHSKVVNQLINEAKKEWYQVIEPLEVFINTGTQKNNLLEICVRDTLHHLKQVENSLTILSHERAAQLLAQSYSYIKEMWNQGGTVPVKDEKLNALIKFLAGIEYYLDMLAGNRKTEDIISIISEQLSVISEQ